MDNYKLPWCNFHKEHEIFKSKRVKIITNARPPTPALLLTSK